MNCLEAAKRLKEIEAGMELMFWEIAEMIDDNDSELFKEFDEPGCVTEEKLTCAYSILTSMMKIAGLCKRYVEDIDTAIKDV